MINVEDIRSRLSTSLYNEIYHYDVLDSTNTFALENQLPERAVVIAEVQTSGKGRSARVWESASNENLYFSIVLPLIDMQKLLPLNIVAGYSVCDTVREYADAFLKWPNDVMIDGRKTGGLLIEVKFSGNQMAKAVLGIGLNVNTTVFPEPIKNIATSISAVSGTVSREDVLVSLLQNFEKRLQELVTNSIDIVSLWPDYSSYLNQQIRIHVGDKKEMYIERGINTNGGLIVEGNSGKLSELYTGDIGYDFSG